MTNHIKKYLLTGLLIILPTYLTVVIIYNSFVAIDNILNPYIEKFLGYTIPGFGFFVVVSGILFVGMFTSNFIGRKLVSMWESTLKKIPFISTVFNLVNEISHTVLGRDKMLFSKVVMFEYPRRGLYSVGFITHGSEGNYLGEYTGEKLVNLFLPTTPNPTSGLIIIVPEDELIPLNVGVEEAMKFVMSAGALIPPTMKKDAEAQLPLELENQIKQLNK